MIRKIKYIYKIIILIISIILFTGCNAPVGSNDLSEMLNGMPYSFYKTYQHQNNEYSIYAIDKESIDILNGIIIQSSWLIILIILGNLFTNKILKRVSVQGG